MSLEARNQEVSEEEGEVPFVVLAVPEGFPAFGDLGRWRSTWWCKIHVLRGRESRLCVPLTENEMILVVVCEQRRGWTSRFKLMRIK